MPIAALAVRINKGRSTDLSARRNDTWKIPDEDAVVDIHDDAGILPVLIQTLLVVFHRGVVLEVVCGLVTLIDLLGLHNVKHPVRIPRNFNYGFVDM